MPLVKACSREFLLRRDPSKVLKPFLQSFRRTFNSLRCVYRIESSVFRIEIGDRCSICTSCVVACNPLYRGMKTACAESWRQTLGKRCVAGKRKWRKSWLGQTSNRNLQKNMNNDTFSPRAVQSARDVGAQWVRGPFAEIGTAELQPQPCPHCGTLPYKL